MDELYIAVKFEVANYFSRLKFLKPNQQGEKVKPKPLAGIRRNSSIMKLSYHPDQH
jgi:hypothetical protein